MRSFVQAKAWQLVLLIVGIPTVGILWYGMTFRPTADSRSVDIVLLAATLWMNVFLITWISSAVKALHGSGLKKFKTAVVLFYSLLLLFSVIIVGPPSSIMDSLDSVFSLLETLVLVGIAAYFYIVAFAARTIVKADESGDTTFFGTFLQIMFFPIGVWFVQPRINKIVQRERS